MPIPINKPKKHFEVIRQAEIASLIESSRRFRILSLTYDPSLARTREMLLTGAGFEVSTFADVDKAIAACQNTSYDLVVLGHSIPLAERRSLVKAVRSRCATPVLAMLRHGETPVPQADYFFDSTENPARLLAMVQDILSPKEKQA
jgi:DNA-binding NtrC family response regulator